MCIAVWIEPLEYLPYTSSRAVKPYLFDTRESILWKTVFSQIGVGVVSRCFKLITCIVHFISNIMTSAAPQIIRHQIPKVVDPCSREPKCGMFVCVYTCISECLQIAVEFNLENLFGNLLKRLPDIQGQELQASMKKNRLIV